MESRDYQAVITARVSAEDALWGISRVSQWWTKGFSGESSAVGDRFTVRFGDTFVDFQVVELTPARAAWEVTNCNLAWISDKTEWKGTRVTWDLAAKNGSTQVRMTHQIERPASKLIAAVSAAWPYALSNLKSLLETGEVAPAAHPGH